MALSIITLLMNRQTKSCIVHLVISIVFEVLHSFEMHQ